MKRIFYILLFVLGLQTVSSAQRITNKGTDFWAGAGHTGPLEGGAWFPGDTPRVFFVITTDVQAADVTISLNGTTYQQKFTVPPNTVYTSDRMPIGLRDVPGSLYDAMLYSRPAIWGGTNSEGIFAKKGIKIHSSVPVVVTEFEIFEYSSAATMLIPTDCWGKSYKILQPKQWVDDITKTPYFAWLFVIADNDNTRIKINPSHSTRSGLPANVPIYVTLNKGEIYQILAGADDVSQSNDFCGTTVNSVANSDGKCLPIATFVGSSGDWISCGPKPASLANMAPDMMIHQVFPVEAWGRRYVTIPTSVVDNATKLNANIFRVMVKDPSIVVKRNGVPLTGLTPQNFYEFISNTADYLEADGPVQVAQIMPSTGSDCNYSGLADPDMTYLSPIEQSIKKVGFLRPKKDKIDRNYLALSIPTAGLSSLMVEGKANNFYSYPNPNLPGYSVVIREWNVNSNSDPRAPAQTIVTSDSAFTAMTYGFGQANSYSYNAGAYIDNLSGVPYIKNKYNKSDTANTYTCANTPVELSVLIRYKPTKILWQLSALKDTISPNADVVINNPVEAGTVMVWGVPYYKYTLPGYYKFSTPGTINIPVFATAPDVEACDNTEQIKYRVIVKDTLKTNFDILFDDKCADTKLVKFVANDKFTDGSAAQGWQWNFLNGTTPLTGTGKELSLTFNAGKNSAELMAIDAAGCIADTTKTFVIGAKPAIPDFTVDAAMNCEQTQLKISENTPVTAQSYYWNYGDGVDSTLTLNGYATSHAYKNAGTITIKHVAKISDNCVSDTATKVITIYGKPKLNVAYPKGCRPDDGIIKFTSAVVTSDNQAISSYLWNFGDAASTPANPNTATTANASHMYANPAVYKLSFSATSEKGCVSDTAWDASFQPKPIIKFDPITPPAVCLNAKGTVSVAFASVTNGVTGKGYYKGDATDATGNFTPSLTTAGKHDIWYIYGSDNGCTDSASNVIFVRPVPQASFTTLADVCFGDKSTFTDQSTINTAADPAAAIGSWTWNFGDGNPDVTYTNGNPFDKTFATAKSYPVTLKVTSKDGCVSDVFTKTLNVHVLPTAAFDLPTAVCMPGGDAVFTNKSSSTEPGTLTYNWQFGDGGTSTDVNPTHVYTAQQPYTVTLKATSAFGCFATTNKQFTSDVFKPKPVVAFDISDKGPCEGVAVIFTDKSTSASGAITAWNWSFGDGTSSTEQTSSKLFDKFGTYAISLTVTDNNGCTASGATADDNVTVRIKPVIDAGPDMAAEENTSVVLKATAQNANQLSYSWAPASLLNNPTILNPSYYVIQDQIFVLTATDKDGICKATDQMLVKILRPVKVPNVFTPNGDGINDTWNIKNLADYVDCTLTVFNRYGQKVYTTHGYSTPWDGRMNGSPLPVGTYYYVINVKQGEPPMTGSVTILR
ncbi:PKD domain-containing protein [Pinibacter aurantiacus]|uniref:PKD domain-containing protein n=1 Tax=Pinibacter aurantiacus TaxID=2851599 RepID=A0A9E2W416_9BACT|nr:PKD domain-containing protein [Pinibacter aurantiacus]MBV4357424.1 PKD domain-containing protein [Pinibacter aurantiacus]